MFRVRVRTLAALVMAVSLWTIPTPAVAQNGDSRELIIKYWKGDDRKALAVAYCESRYNNRAQNGSHRGVFQLTSKYHQGRAAKFGYSWEDMYDAGKNTRVAYDLYLDKGWGPWTCA